MSIFGSAIYVYLGSIAKTDIELPPTFTETLIVVSNTNDVKLFLGNSVKSLAEKSFYTSFLQTRRIGTNGNIDIRDFTA